MLYLRDWSPDENGSASRNVEPLAANMRTPCRSGSLPGIPGIAPIRFAARFHSRETVRLRVAEDRWLFRERRRFVAYRVLQHSWGVHLMGIAAVLAGWQCLTIAKDEVPDIVMVASFMLTELTADSHGDSVTAEFWGPLGLSTVRYASGLAISVPTGVVLGMLIGSSRMTRALRDGATLFCLVLPVVMWAFVAPKWFGYVATPVLAVVLTTVPPIAIGLSSGVRNIDPTLIEMTKSFQVTRRNLRRHMLLGGAATQTATAFRLAAPIGSISLFVVEWVSATSGVGWRARSWYEDQHYEGFMGWTLLVVAVIILFDLVVLQRLERQAARWR